MAGSFRSRLVPAAVAAALACVPPAVGLAQEFVGLVVEADGRMEPRVAAYSELASGTTVVLDDYSRLKVAFYPACEVVSFIGGEIDFARYRYVARGSKVRVDRQRTCPTRYKLKKREIAGGMIMRGGGTTITARPTIVLSGPGAKSIQSIRVSHQQRTVVEVMVADGKPAWPASLALTPGLSYRLDFISAQGLASQATFEARASPSAQPTDNLLIVAVE